LRLPAGLSVARESDKRISAVWLWGGWCYSWRLVSKLSRLTRTQCITLLLFVIIATNWGVEGITGYSILGEDLFVFFTIIFIALSVITLAAPLTHRLVWRVRNRLLLTYFLVGAIPTVLILVMGVISVAALLGATVSYLCRSELDHRLEHLEKAARLHSRTVFEGKQLVLPEWHADQAIVRVADRTVASQGAISDIPSGVTLASRASSERTLAHTS
jgi:uncharacterized membrane protein YuzA (DUF378 family)